MKNLTISYLVYYEMNLFEYCTNNIIIFNDEVEAIEFAKELSKIYQRVDQLLKTDIPTQYLKNIIREEFPKSYQLYPLKNHSRILAPIWLESIFLVEKVVSKK